MPVMLQWLQPKGALWSYVKFTFLTPSDMICQVCAHDIVILFASMLYCGTGLCVAIDITDLAYVVNCLPHQSHTVTLDMSKCTCIKQGAESHVIQALLCRLFI